MNFPLVVNQPPAASDIPLHLCRADPVENGAARLSWEPERPGESEEIPPRWRLKGSIAVVLMAEKLFAGARASARRDEISWPAMPSMFEDLLMVMQRFPIAIDKSAREIWEEQYADVLKAWFIRSRPEGQAAQGGGRFKGVLRTFQQEGVRFLLAGSRAVLADDMGLGKTVQAFAYLDTLDKWPVVIVCQSHVQSHWAGKIGEFLKCEPARGGLLASSENLRWTVLRGAKAQDDTPEADVYIVHYLVVHAWVNLLLARGVKAVVFDEVQELRATGTRKYESCRLIAKTAKCAVGLSGTPIYNKGGEIYNVLNALNRGCLGTKVSFQETWCSEHDPSLVKSPEALGAYLTEIGLMLRRRKDEVLSELPEKQRVIEPIDADNKLFAELIQEAAELARDADMQNDPFAKGMKEAEAIAKARKATGISKAPGVVAFVRGLMEAEQPTLVFAHHHDVHDAILEALDDFNPVSITGRESPAQKDTARNAFMRGDSNLCLIALRAATGIDGLQSRARVVVFAELDWSPAVHAQAEDRAHRMGQKNGVLVYYLTTELGTDPGMMEILSVKERQFLGLMNEEGETEEAAREASAAAERHKAEILSMLRGMRE
jgi:SNF2 family DNA or RNA helicase